MESTRRGFLKTGLVSASATVVGTGTLLADAGKAAAANIIPAASGVVPFYGNHQSGIATPAQNYLQFAAFDITSESRSDLRALLRTWSDAAALLTVGRPVGPMQTGTHPPVDTGEAVGTEPSELTITFGFGPTLFTSAGGDRFGLTGHRPAPLVDLPAFVGDNLQSDISGGDVCIQVCANDPQVAFHAVHDLMKLGKGIAEPIWLLAGFGRTGNTTHQKVPRNLMGFQDGTANIKAEESEALAKFVWAGEPGSPAWMRGGSYLVARRIEIALGLWDETGLSGQEQSIGREKLSGKLLPHPPPAAHITLTSPAENGGQRILRRGYSYLDGLGTGLVTPAAGLMFLCYQRDPRKQFIPIQRKIAGKDALSEYLTHVGSAVFACPPGARRGGYVGEGLLG